MKKDEIKIVLSDPEQMELDFDDTISAKYVEPDHRLLSNLDYEHSGHTGFMPARISILPEIQADVPNERISLLVSDGENSGTIKLTDLRDRMIKTSASIPDSIEIGQYLFLEKK